MSSRRQMLTDAEAVAQVTLGLEVMLQHHGWAVGDDVVHDGGIPCDAPGRDRYLEKLMRMWAQTVGHRSTADRRNVQLNLLSGGFTPSGFEPDGDWAGLSDEAYAACWVMGRELAGEEVVHSHSEGSAAECSHPECLIRHLRAA
jgi:hypothetical protein